jgi:hypothetical protein
VPVVFDNVFRVNEFVASTIRRVSRRAAMEQAISMVRRKKLSLGRLA